MRIGIDSGGTFTDFIVVHDDGRLETFKLRSNPRDPASVILEGLRQAAGEKRADIVHGSTVATNALLERKGAKTAFVTTRGFEDIIHIGRQNRAHLYSLVPIHRNPIVGRELCFGVDERSHFDGTVEKAPRKEEIQQLKTKLAAAGVRSVALCFLHSYQNPENEQIVAELLEGEFYLSPSHFVCPEFREYERASTTVINAYVGPLMSSYLSELQKRCPHDISIMQSSGGFLSAAEAGRHAVRTVLSGPAGGVVGAVEMAKLSGYGKVLGFDMGGTSTDVSLAEGRPREAQEASIDGFPIRVPILDIHTVGAGGGSIARVDPGGLLRVGPESAGADPGPACYGAGDRPTVTDAHVVLGRIGPDQLLGGTMHLHVDRANRAVNCIAGQLGLDRVAAAEGILRVANANMQRAIRVVSVERGHDPREFALAAFGGCGGLHACEVAEELGIATVLVPRYAGALSALGMLMADRMRDYAAGVLGRKDVEDRFRELELRAAQEIPGAQIERLADLRYAGQSYEITVPWNGQDPAAPFHEAHEKLYGYRDPKRPMEIVTVRVRARVATPALNFHWEQRAPKAKPETRQVYIRGRWHMTPVLHREEAPAAKTAGPALILDYGSTTLIPPGWSFQVDRIGNLLITRDAQ